MLTGVFPYDIITGYSATDFVHDIICNLLTLCCNNLHLHDLRLKSVHDEINNLGCDDLRYQGVQRDIAPKDKCGNHDDTAVQHKQNAADIHLRHPLFLHNLRDGFRSAERIASPKDEAVACPRENTAKNCGQQQVFFLKQLKIQFFKHEQNRRIQQCYEQYLFALSEAQRQDHDNPDHDSQRVVQHRKINADVILHDSDDTRQSAAGQAIGDHDRRC